MNLTCFRCNDTKRTLQSRQIAGCFSVFCCSCLFVWGADVFDELPVLKDVPQNVLHKHNRRCNYQAHHESRAWAEPKQVAIEVLPPLNQIGCLWNNSLLWIREKREQTSYFLRGCDALSSVCCHCRCFYQWQCCCCLSFLMRASPLLHMGKEWLHSVTF